MRLTEFTNSKTYNLSERDMATLFKQIEKICPDGMPDDIRPTGVGPRNPGGA